MANQTEENKRIVVDMFTRLFNKKDLTAIDEYIGPLYIQHDPRAVDGVEGLRAALEYFPKFPQLHVDIKRVIAEGDLVVLHVHWRWKPEDRGMAVVEILRVENNRIVEHWGVTMDIPEKAMNPNGMF
jgi:predicted SnoaL-like aldol condensation-catalyzing enzyme